MLQLLGINTPAQSWHMKIWGQSGAGGYSSPAAEQDGNVLQLVCAFLRYSPLHRIILGIIVWLLTLVGFSIFQINVSPTSLLLSLTWMGVSNVEMQEKNPPCLYFSRHLSKEKGENCQTKQALQIVLIFNVVVEDNLWTAKFAMTGNEPALSPLIRKWAKRLLNKQTATCFNKWEDNWFINII